MIEGGTGRAAARAAGRPRQRRGGPDRALPRRAGPPRDRAHVHALAPARFRARQVVMELVAEGQKLPAARAPGCGKASAGGLRHEDRGSQLALERREPVVEVVDDAEQGPQSALAEPRRTFDTQAKRGV